MDSILDELTDAQRQAASHIDGPMLMLAGPGSGKTRVVTRRIAYLLSQGVDCREILALTFTNKAAEEMQGRVLQLAPGEQVWMGTFHRFCAQLLRRYANLVGLRENYSIYDMSDSKAAMMRAVEISGVSLSHTSVEQIASAISRFKNELLMPELVDSASLRAGEIIPGKVYPIYQQQLLRSNAVDFDCMLLHVARLLRENPELRSELDRRYRYILVDEYQDTNIAQYAIVRALSIDHQNLSVTGDPDQSIYGWRGANLNNILEFENDYPNVRTIRLEQNYRSTPNILRVADQLITNNTRRKHKGLFTHIPEGAPVRLRIYESGQQEADDIADQIVTEVYNGRRRPRDYAIFCRMNSLTRSIEHALRQRGVPYTIVRGVEFYQRKEIKDLLAYLQLTNNPSHDVALQRIINTPARGIGKKTIERLMAFANDQEICLLEAVFQADKIPTIKKAAQRSLKKFGELMHNLSLKASAPLEDLMQFLLDEIQYVDYLDRTVAEDKDTSASDNVSELMSAAAEFDNRNEVDNPLEAFLEQIALISDTDAWEDTSDRVSVMTMHAAKGLEFPCVFVIAVEDEVLPHRRSKNDPMMCEEERRLLFVGITRAEEFLQLSMAHRRTVRGASRLVAASPFLLELPKDEMEVIDSGRYSDYSMNDGFEMDSSYPKSWDLDEAESQEIPEYQESKKKSDRPALAANIKTAAELLGQQEQKVAVDPSLFDQGMIVSHPDYGSGRIVSVSGTGKMRMVYVEFFADRIKRNFLTSFADLTLEGEG